MNAFWSPSGSVDATNSVVGYTSAEVSTLLIRLPTAIIEALSKSTIGDKLLLVVDKEITKNNDLAPPSSFVSFTGDAIILDESNLKFSFNGMTVEDVSVVNEVSEPAGLVPLVDLILAEIVVSGIYLLSPVPTIPVKESCNLLLIF